MTKDEAVAHVAGHAASFLQGGDFAEATGLELDTLSDADVERLGEAVGIVVNRLYGMGKGGRS